MDERLPAGSPVRVSATLPAGAYTFCIVANGVYVEGQLFTDATVVCVDVELQDARGRLSLPPTEIWASAEAGSYDLLALAPLLQSGAARIVGGHSLDAEPGLLVFEQVGARTSPLLLLVSAALAFFPGKRRLHRASMLRQTRRGS